MWQRMMSVLDGFYIPTIHVSDIVEIFIIVFFLYIIIKSIKNTRTFVLVKAVAILAILYLLAELFSFNAIKIIFQGLAWAALVAAVVIFQPELRKLLERIGAVSLNHFSLKDILVLFGKEQYRENFRYSDETIKQMTNGCFKLGSAKTGALIVFQGDVPLNDYIATGIPLNSDITEALLINIFEKNTPLHDGAVIAIGDKLIAATCYLPLTDNPNINKDLGTRHRAAIGISEVIDCAVIVVSEETGNVSYVINGKITHCKTPEALTSELKKFQEKTNIIKKKNKKLTHNLGIKAFSIIAGVLLWFAIIIANDPIETRLIANVPITITNEDAITDIDKVYYITSGNTVNVMVKDTRSVIDRLTRNDISVTADMSKLSYVFSVPLSARANNRTTQVSFIDDNTITVRIEDIINKEFPLTFKTTGTPSSDIYISKVTSSIDSVIVTGAESVINTIDYVEYSVNVTGARENFSKEVTPVIYDKNGTIIDESEYSLNRPTVVVSAEALNTKTIPLNISLMPDDSQDYKMTVKSYNPNTVIIAASDEKLEEIEELNIEIKSEMDISSVIKDVYEKEINIADYLPDEVYIADGIGRTTISMSYEPFTTREIVFNSSDIEILNRPRNLSLRFKDESYTVTVTGIADVLEKLTIQDLSPYVDLSELTKGTYNIQLIFKNPNSFKLQAPTGIVIELY